jgi:hypothetical protein
MRLACGNQPPLRLELIFTNNTDKIYVGRILSGLIRVYTRVTTSADSFFSGYF